jgi:hypothetical protein
MLKYPLACLSFFLFSLACFGQGDQISLQFVSFPKLGKATPLELIVGEGKTINVELPTNCLSPIYKVDRQKQWLLGKSTTDDEGKLAFETYGKINALTSSEQLILVVRKGSNDSDGFELIAMSNQKSQFGGGKYFFMNAAKVDIAVEIGDKKVSLKPRTHTLVEPNPSKVKGKRKYLYTHLHFRKGTKAVPFYSSTWRFSKKARCMVFLYHDSHTQQLRTHTIRDYIQ